MKKIYLYSLSMWMLFVIVAILNGTFRETVITPNTNELFGHIMSSIIFIFLIFFLTYLFLKSLKTNYSQKELLRVGALWLLLTILFEFLFGHFAMGHPWSKLLADYNILNGRVWSLVLIATFIAPFFCGQYFLKKRSKI